MPFLNLSHVTRYTYRQPVSFGEHRIMVRPRESYDQHLIDAELRIDPAPVDIRWLQDVFGNSVAIATFDRPARELVFDSQIRLQHMPSELQHVDIEDYAQGYPFTYSSEDMPDLLRSIERQHHDPQRQIDSWARRFVNTDGPTDTLHMLSEMTRAIKREFTYVGRPEKGTQSPIETLARRKGTCRANCSTWTSRITRKAIPSPTPARTCRTCCDRSSASITIRSARSTAGRGASSPKADRPIRYRCCPT